MARLRPGRCVKTLKQPYSRYSKYRKYNFVASRPPSRINVYEMGNVKGEYDLTLYLISKDDLQVRSNALESARLAANKYLEKILGRDNYYLKVISYPFNVIREHSFAGVAGADRLSRGMILAFGKPSGVGARLKVGSKIFMLKVKKENEKIAREALKRASKKLPCKTTIVEEEKLKEVIKLIKKK